MTYQKDPQMQVPANRRMVREEGGSSFLTAVVGIVFVLLVGLIAYNMYVGNAARPGSLNPSAQAPSVTQPQPTTPPRTTPPAN